MGHIKVFHWQGSNSQLSSVPKIRFPKMTLTQLSGFGFFSKGSQKSLSLARFELTIICIGALFVVTKWYMIIEYKHHNQSWKQKFLNSQTVQTIHHSQQGPGRGEFWLSRVFVFLCSSTCIPNSKIELECIIKK